VGGVVVVAEIWRQFSVCCFLFIFHQSLISKSSILSSFYSSYRSSLVVLALVAGILDTNSSSSFCFFLIRV